MIDFKILTFFYYRHILINITRMSNYNYSEISPEGLKNLETDFDGNLFGKLLLVFCNHFPHISNLKYKEQLCSKFSQMKVLGTQNKNNMENFRQQKVFPGRNASGNKSMKQKQHIVKEKMRSEVNFEVIALE
ncbi:hypothetical protein BLOT_001444 [Blomia tropicalis]|nr:hypothetical protein BLOT_001444 [Blomia tropicalis]